MKRLILPLILLLATALIAAQTVAPEDQIESLIDDMEAAVLAGNAGRYLSYVDLSDANFAVEHTNWVNDWAEGQYLVDFNLGIADLDVGTDAATGTLTLHYRTTLEEIPSMTIRIPVQFTYHEEIDQWLFAGEYWITTESDYFLIHAAPGLEDVVESLLPELPTIYQTVTMAYGHMPEMPMQIKLYRTRPEVAAMTLLSLPPISGWNEPNESLKSVGTDPDRLPGIIAHEFTHFLTFDEAGQTRGMMPWWLAEGIATYIAQPFDDRGDARYNDWLTTAQQLLLTRQLVDWVDLAVYESVPVDQWSYAYIQGYTFVYFLTGTYGEAVRNDWLEAMADRDIDSATETVFEMPFDALDQEFQTWLRALELE